MFNKRLLVSITLDKNKLKKNVKDSCNIECIPTVKLLTKTEREELRECLNRACELVRESYVRFYRRI
jgi:hypothetical protein